MAPDLVLRHKHDNLCGGEARDPAIVDRLADLHPHRACLLVHLLLDGDHLPPRAGSPREGGGGASAGGARAGEEGARRAGAGAGRGRGARAELIGSRQMTSLKSNGPSRTGTCLTATNLGSSAPSATSASATYNLPGDLVRALSVARTGFGLGFTGGLPEIRSSFHASSGPELDGGASSSTPMAVFTFLNSLSLTKEWVWVSLELDLVPKLPSARSTRSVGTSNVSSSSMATVKPLCMASP